MTAGFCIRRGFRTKNTVQLESEETLCALEIIFNLAIKHYCTVYARGWVLRSVFANVTPITLKQRQCFVVHYKKRRKTNFTNPDKLIEWAICDPRSS